MYTPKCICPTSHGGGANITGVQYSNITGTISLATVATTGAYSDLQVHQQILVHLQMTADICKTYQQQVLLLYKM